MRRVIGALGALAVFAASASPAAARHAYSDPGHVRIGAVRTIDNLNPLLSGQAASTDTAQFLFSGLIRFDDHGDPVPDAAESVPTQANGGISRDGKTITYRLRAGVRFSDGHPLTADDVVFTWQQVMNPRNNVPFHFPYDQAQSVTAKDPRTVVVRLRESSAPFVSNFFRCGAQGAILPKHLLQGKPDLNHEAYNNKPVGSGPFMVERYDINSRLEMVPNPYWFGGKPGLNRVTYRIIPSENTLLIALKTHEIDFYYAAPEQQYRELKSLAGVTVSAMPSAQFEMVAFNGGREPLSDVRLRRAVAMGTDWHALARTVYLDVDLADWGDIFPRSWAYTAQPDPASYDPAKARALLDEAGWKPGSDGIRAKNGKRLELEIRTVAGVITRENLEVAIQQSMKAIGVDLQVHNGPANMLFAPIGAGGLLASGKFDLGIYAWTKNPDPDDSQTAGPAYLPPHGANYSRIADAKIGELERRANAVYDRAKRKEIYAQLERRIGEVLPYHTIVWRANVNAWNDDLHGVKPAQAVSDFWNVGSWTM
ncbi:MAG TPA: peptide ABC transporter substrate-binding protein [Dongiaceae bacterium]|nr:peptide ABC transporter substrate-binding protein [Dongiaceae bacterium]